MSFKVGDEVIHLSRYRTTKHYSLVSVIIKEVTPTIIYTNHRLGVNRGYPHRKPYRTVIKPNGIKAHYCRTYNKWRTWRLNGLLQRLKRCFLSLPRERDKRR